MGPMWPIYCVESANMVFLFFVRRYTFFALLPIIGKFLEYTIYNVLKRLPSGWPDVMSISPRHFVLTP